VTQRNSVTMEDVVAELGIDAGEWRYALDLQMVRGGNRGIRHPSDQHRPKGVA
jgi:hypothetical protein